MLTAMRNILLESTLRILFVPLIVGLALIMTGNMETVVDQMVAAQQMFADIEIAMETLAK